MKEGIVNLSHGYTMEMYYQVNNFGGDHASDEGWSVNLYSPTGEDIGGCFLVVENGSDEIPDITEEHKKRALEMSLDSVDINVYLPEIDIMADRVMPSIDKVDEGRKETTNRPINSFTKEGEKGV